MYLITVDGKVVREEILSHKKQVMWFDTEGEVADYTMWNTFPHGSILRQAPVLVKKPDQVIGNAVCAIWNPSQPMFDPQRVSLLRTMRMLNDLLIGHEPDAADHKPFAVKRNGWNLIVSRQVKGKTLVITIAFDGQLQFGALVVTDAYELLNNLSLRLLRADGKV